MPVLTCTVRIRNHFIVIMTIMACYLKSTGRGVEDTDAT